MSPLLTSARNYLCRVQFQIQLSVEIFEILLSVEIIFYIRCNFRSSCRPTYRMYRMKCFVSWLSAEIGKKLNTYTYCFQECTRKSLFSSRGGTFRIRSFEGIQLHIYLFKYFIIQFHNYNMSLAATKAPRKYVSATPEKILSYFKCFKKKIGVIDFWKVVDKDEFYSEEIGEIRTR